MKGRVQSGLRTHKLTALQLHHPEVLKAPSIGREQSTFTIWSFRITIPVHPSCGFDDDITNSLLARQ